MVVETAPKEISVKETPPAIPNQEIKTEQSDELKIEDLIPKKTSFSLTQTGETYHLRPCTPGMLVKAGTALGNIQEMIALPSAENVAKISMFLMEYESQKHFKKQSVNVIDIMTGDERVEDLGGYILLMNLFNDLQEQMNVYVAILGAMGFEKSRVDSLIEGYFKEANDALEDYTEEAKKKIS